MYKIKYFPREGERAALGGAQDPWERLSLLFPLNGLTVVPSQAKERNQIKRTSSPSFFSGDSSRHHQLSAPVGWVERTEKRGSWQSRVGTTVGPTTWKVQATMPPHRRIHSPCTQLSPLGCDGPSVFENFRSCLYTDLLGATDLRLCTHYNWLLWAWQSQTRSLTGLPLFIQDLSSRLCCFSATFLSRCL